MNHMIDRRSYAAMGLAGSAALVAGAARAAKPGSDEAPADRTGKKTQVTMLLYPGTTVLDWVGPYEALHRVEGVEVVLAARASTS